MEQETTKRACDRPLHIRRRLVLILAGALGPALVWVLSRWPEIVEQVYTQRIGQFVGRVLASVSGLVPFSVAEFLLALLLLGFMTGTLKSLGEVLRGKRRASNAVACGLLRMGAWAGALTATFYMTWGFNYAQPDLVTRLHWERFADVSGADADSRELARLCEEVVEAGNREYAAAFGTEDLGEASEPPMALAHLDAVIDAAYVRVAERLELTDSFAQSRGRAKPVMASPVMSRLLILGTYTPWTGEANFNPDMPACRLPEVIAHEKAHQRGVTSEDEANFYGFLACAYSEEPYARYSAYLMAQRLLLGELSKREPTAAKVLIKTRYPGVQRDADTVRKFWDQHHGRISDAQNVVNNLYLKGNRVKQGIQAYQMTAKLLIVFAHANDGTCLVGHEKYMRDDETIDLLAYNANSPQTSGGFVGRD